MTKTTQKKLESTKMQRKQVFNCCCFIWNIGRRVLKYTKRLITKVWVVFCAWLMSCWKRDTKEEPKAEAVCGRCGKEGIENFTELLEQTLEENKRLKTENDDLKADYKYLLENYRDVKKKSEKITADMADTLEKKGDLENVNDEFANTKLGKTFENLYDNTWAELTEFLYETLPDFNELDRIKALTTLMKKAHNECLSLADEQLRRFLFLSKEEEVPSFKDNDLLYKTRRLCGQKLSTRESVAKKVMSTVLSSEELQSFKNDENKNEANEKIEDFFRRYIDCCWLMIISHPKMILVFDVIGKPYTGVIKERFKQFSTQKDVEDMNLVKDSVFEVVWPCVVLEDGSGVYAKGDVITVDIGKEV